MPMMNLFLNQVRSDGPFEANEGALGPPNYLVSVSIEAFCPSN